MLFTQLADWIQPQHLDAAARQAHAAGIAASPARMRVVDDFLRPERLEDLRAVLREAGELRPTFALFGQGRARVEAEAWRVAPPEQHFYHHLEVVGPQLGFELSRAYLTHVSLRDVLTTRPFLDYFGELAGACLTGVSQVNAKALGSKQFLRPHSDAEPGRRLCAVLYLNDDWRPDYGGHFLLYRDAVEVDRVAPIGNRLLLFVPDTAYRHAIEPLTPAAGAWRRWNYSFWLVDETCLRT